MIRFIIKSRRKDSISGLESESLQTIDAEVQSLEKILCSGGFGENGYEVNDLVGACILQEK